MKIVVLAGGLSTERDVSITSGSLVAKALREKGHPAKRIFQAIRIAVNISSAL